MNILTIGDYFERVVSLARSAVDNGMSTPADEVRREINKELDCFLAPSDHQPHCDALVGAIAMLVAAGYARDMDLKASMIRWLKDAAEKKPGGVRLPNGRRATGEDVTR